MTFPANSRVGTDSAAEARGTESSASTPATSQSVLSRNARIVGIDAARGLALIGMMAVHIFPVYDESDGTPSLAWSVFAGRSAALFAVLAGVGIALTTGRRRGPGPGQRTAASVSVAVRAAILVLIGLALGHFSENADVILAFYGVMFLLAIPLLRLSPRALALVAVATAILAPVLMQGLRDYLPDPPLDDPTFGSLADPGGLATDLLITGVYPALPWMAYIACGLAIGRLMRPSVQFAVRLLTTGTAVAVVAWASSTLLLGVFGGLEQIRASSPGMGEEALNDILLWGPDPTLPTSSWWWLAIRAPHSTTPIDMLHTIGTSMAVLGAMLLLSRVAARALRPLAAAGSTTLTLYTLHVLVVSSGVASDWPYLSFVVQVVAALAFAVFWRKRFGQGPLERAVSWPAKRASAAVLSVRKGAGRRAEGRHTA